MKKYLICAAAFAVLMIAAVFAYDTLTKNSSGAAPALTGQAEAAPDKESPAQAADFTVYDQDGNAVSLSDFLGRPVIVNFWTTWCVPCVRELPEFEKLYAEYGDEVQFLMTGIPARGNTRERVADFAEKNCCSFPIYYDDDLSATDAYSIHSVPMTLFIGSGGELVKKYTGTLSGELLREYLRLILDGE